MNDLILSLAMAALGQFASLGGGFGPVLGGGLGYGGAPGGAGTTGGGERARQVVTVAVVRCLVEEGRLDPGQAGNLLGYQAERRGWPRGWERRVSPSQVERTIRRVGGCDPLMARLREGSAGRGSGSGSGAIVSRSEREGFGLAPYR